MTCGFPHDVFYFVILASGDWAENEIRTVYMKRMEERDLVFKMASLAVSKCLIFYQ